MRKMRGWWCVVLGMAMVCVAQEPDDQAPKKKKRSKPEPETVTLTGFVIIRKELVQKKKDGGERTIIYLALLDEEGKETKLFVKKQPKTNQAGDNSPAQPASVDLHEYIDMKVRIIGQAIVFKKKNLSQVIFHQIDNIIILEGKPATEQ